MVELREASLDLMVGLARVMSHDSVLDYACGPGLAGFAVAPDVRSVAAVDELPDMLDEGERLAAELGFTNIAFTLVDLSALPYDDGAFGLVVCRNAFHLLPEPVAALGELLRVTAAGGRIVVVDAIVDEVNDKALNDLARLREPAHRRHYRAEQLRGLAAQAGLRVCADGMLRCTVDLDSWLGAAAVPPAKAGFIRDRVKELPLEIQEHLDTVFADHLTSFSYDMLGLRLERA